MGKDRKVNNKEQGKRKAIANLRRVSVVLVGTVPWVDDTISH